MTPLQIKQQEYAQKQQALLDYIKTLKNADGSVKAYSDEEKAKLDTLSAEVKALKAEIERLEALSGLEKQAESEIKSLHAVLARTLPKPGEEDGNSRKAFTLPARALTSGVKSFKPREGMSAEERAYRFGNWFSGAVLGRGKAVQFCRDHGVEMRYLNDEDAEVGEKTYKSMTEGVNASGGALVPEEFTADIIDLRERRGVLRANMTPEPMTRDTKRIPRRDGGATAYWISEGQQIPSSDLAFSSVNLTAKKLAALTKCSTELFEDTIISIGDRVIMEMAYSFADAEDKAGFIGDGTSTYGRCVGFTEALKALSGTIANIAGLVVGTGNAYSELILNDFIGVTALLPEYADDATAKWYMHKTFFYNVCTRVALAAGGVFAEEIRNGMREPRFLGYPVQYTQVMPKTEGNSQVCALLGDVNRAGSFGDRRQITFATSDQFLFDTDMIAMRCTERVDFNAHDVGNASATASARQAGPIVGLITAAS